MRSSSCSSAASVGRRPEPRASVSRSTSSCAVGQELVQRRVEQADRDRQPGHRREQALEVGLLQRQQLIQRGAALGVALGHDHRAHLRLAVGGHEHVLGPAQADALRAVAERRRASAGVSALARTPSGAGSSPQPSTRSKRSSRAVHQRDVVARDHAGAAVDGDPLARGRRRSPTRISRAREVDVELAGADHRGAAHAARDERGVRGLAALGGEDAARGVEAGDVVGLGERAHEDDVAALRGGRDRLLGGEHDLALGRAGRGGDAAREHLEARRRGRTSGAAARRARRRRSSRIACARVSRPSSTASTAKRTAAWAGRLALRVCSM